MMLHRLLGRRRRFNDSVRRPLARRRLNLEFLESKSLVAGDIFSMGAAPLFGVDSLLSANAPLIQQLSDGTEQVDISLKITDTSGMAITQLEAGQDFILQVWVQDVRADAPTPGVAAAYTNVSFDASMMTPVGAVNHGTDFTTATSGDTLTSGLISEAGGFDADFTPIGSAEHMLVSQQFHVDAAASGNVSFTTSPAVNLPAHDTLVTPASSVPTSQIGYGALSMLVVPGPTLTSSNVQQAEGDSQTSTMTFTVNLGGAAATTPVTVDYATVDGTAKAGSDYVATSGTLTFDVGQTSQNINVTINGDTTFEPDEQFSIAFSNATGAIAPATVTGTILNDDSAPQISINDISIPEGDSGSTPANFTVNLSNASSQPVSVDYTFAPGTATEGSDYEATAGTLTFNPGDTSAQIPVSILGDKIYEGDERFTVTLQNPVGGVLEKPTGTATIVDDDPQPTLSIDSPAAVTEPTGSTTDLTFNVTLTGATALTTTVNWATADDTATAGQDYTAASGQLTFLPGETSKQVTVTVLDDNLNEATEDFFVQLSSPTNATVPAAGATGVGTILDDGDAAPTVSVSGPASIPEGDSGTSAYTFNVTLSAPSGQNVTVDYATADDGSAVAGVDYEPTSGTLTFAPGQTTLPVTVNVIGNSTYQDNRTFVLDLSNPQHTSIVTGEAVGTIADDDNPPVLTIGDESIPEGNSGTSTMTFTASLSQASGKPVTFDYTTADGTATAGSDYEATSGTLTINPGDTSVTINVPIDGDTTVEDNETFTVNLSNVVNATPNNLQATGTIQDDDGLVVTVAPASVKEGDSGNSTMTFTATLAQSSDQPLTFDWATVPGSGTATAGVDYESASGTATFAAGATTTTFTVNVIGDTLNEDNETFQVALSNPSSGTIGNAGPVTGTILDDDTAPTASITGGSIIAGDSGTSTLNFTVHLDNPSGKTVTIDYATADGTATAGSDYVGQTGTVTFAPGQTSQTIGVVIDAATALEPDETFTVGLSNAANATLGTAQATGTIIDNDSFIVAAVDTVLGEGDSGTSQMTFTLSLSRPAVGPLTVSYATSPETASDSGPQQDYDDASGIATFADGATSTTVNVTILGDTLNEADETLMLALSNPSYGVVQGGPATGTIINDDAPPTMSIASPAAVDGGVTGTPLNFVVTLAQASGQSVTVDYATANGTAIAGTDYTAASGTLTFAPGQTSQTITVNTIANPAAQGDTTFTVNLTNENNATIPGSASATGTILSTLPTISVANSSVTEGNSGTTQMTFTATLSKASTSTVTVTVSTADGTATAAVDYQAASGTLTFNPGVTTQQFTLTIGGDTLYEADETILVNLTNATNATIATPQAIGTILNDDPPPQIFVEPPAPVTEGDSGVTPMTFQVFLLAQSGLPVTINYSTANGTAIAGSDYQATSGTVTIAPGQSTASITVNVIGDTVPEPTETFSLNLTATNGTFVGGVGTSSSVTGTILDDDVPGSFSGRVYQDTNNDGAMDGSEVPMAGVQLMLSGIDSQGNVIVRFQSSAADGTYNFASIPKGTYTVTETPPSGYLNGIETPGAGASTTGVADQFLFTLTSGENITGNNFSVRGLVPQAITKGLFLQSRTNP